MAKQYVIVGTWNFKDAVKGISVYSYEPIEGELVLLDHYDDQVAAGYQAYDKKRNILYVVDECENHSGEKGGGGFIRAYSLCPENGQLTLLSEKNVLMSKPAYLCLDPTGNYCLVACHAGRNCVTKLAHDSLGKWISGVLYDDAGIVLIRINKDGSLGEICDVAIHEGLTKNTRQIQAHPHSIVGSPDGEIYFACDKGLDRIFSYKIDRENNKLIPMAQKKMNFAVAPRYSVFHPDLPVWYENNETNNRMYAFEYDSKSGYISEISNIELFYKEQKAMPSDLVLHPNKKFLYVGIRDLKEIAVLGVNPDTGKLDLRGKAANEGNPRGLAITPDGRYLFVANVEASTLSSFRILEDGMLKDTGKRFTAPSAANIEFITID